MIEREVDEWGARYSQLHDDEASKPWCFSIDF